MQGGFFHSCTSGRCSNGISRPKREPGVNRGVGEGSLQFLRSFDSRTSYPQWGENKGLAPRKSAKLEECLPPSREAEAAALGDKQEGGLGRPRLPTQSRGSRRRRKLRRCPVGGRREGHPRPKYLRPARRGGRGRCCYRPGLSGSGTSSSAATEKPGRGQGEGTRGGRPRPAPPPPPPPLSAAA